LSNFSLRANHGRTKRIALDSETSLYARMIISIWTVAAAALFVAALVAAAMRAGESPSLAGVSIAVSIVSLLAASFLWLARSRVGSRSR